MRYHLFCLSLFKASLTLFSSSALSALQPIEEAPLASEIDHHCHFKDDGTTKCTSTYHYTILRPSGREEISRIDFNFNEDDKLTVEKAELTQPGKKAVPLDKSRIDTRLAPNPAKGFLREKQTSIAFPNLRIGTRVSYTLQQDYAAKPMISGFHYIYNEHPSPQRIDRLNVKFTAERPIVWRSERMENFNITHKKDKKELVVTLKKPPYYLNYVNEANGSYVRQIPRIELASSLDLQDNFGAIAKRYNEILAAKLPPLSAEVVSNIKEKTPEQKVTAVMQHIYDNYRYLGDWRGSERGYIPFSLSEIEEHGYGDCKDLAILLTAMLKASGIKAQPAWIKQGVFLPLLYLSQE